MSSWLLTLLKTILGSISGPLREAIVNSVKEWEAMAKETASPWDDILVGVVKWLLVIE